MASEDELRHELVLVGGIPDEPDHSDVDAICSSPGPNSLFQELYLTLRGLVLTPWEHLEEERTEDELNIRAWSGTRTVGLEWLERKCLETSFVPVNIECITHGLPGMELRWHFALEYAGQLGHTAFRHQSLTARFENQQAYQRFSEVWRKVFARDPVFQVKDLNTSSPR